MGEKAYEGDPAAAVNSTSRLRYEQGFMVGCYGLVEYSVSMSITALFIDRFDLYSKIGIKWIYLFAYVSLACVSFVLFFVPTMKLILSLTWIFGISFAILGSVPFILLGRYHSSVIYIQKVLYILKRYLVEIKSTNFVFKSPNGSNRSFGLDSAILISQNYCGQLFMSLFIGPLIAFYESPEIIYLMAAIVASIGSIICGVVVEYDIEWSKSHSSILS